MPTVSGYLDDLSVSIYTSLQYYTSATSEHCDAAESAVLAIAILSAYQVVAPALSDHSPVLALVVPSSAGMSSYKDTDESREGHPL